MPAPPRRMQAGASSLATRLPERAAAPAPRDGFAAASASAGEFRDWKDIEAACARALLRPPGERERMLLRLAEPATDIRLLLARNDVAAVALPFLAFAERLYTLPGTNASLDAAPLLAELGSRVDGAMLQLIRAARSSADFGALVNALEQCRVPHRGRLLPVLAQHLAERFPADSISSAPARHAWLRPLRERLLVLAGHVGGRAGIADAFAPPPGQAPTGQRWQHNGIARIDDRDIELDDTPPTPPNSPATPPGSPDPEAAPP